MLGSHVVTDGAPKFSAFIVKSIQNHMDKQHEEKRVKSIQNHMDKQQEDKKVKIMLNNNYKATHGRQ